MEDHAVKPLLTVIRNNYSINPEIKCLLRILGYVSDARHKRKRCDVDRMHRTDFRRLINFFACICTDLCRLYAL